jgi:hypothetical protein
MTKQLLLIPLITACTIDMEMQLEVGLKDRNADLEDLIEEGAEAYEDYQSEEEDHQEEDRQEEEDYYCDIAIYDVHVERADNAIYFQWEINGNPDTDDVVVALLQGNEAISFEFLPFEENEYVFEIPEEGGEYAIYIASGNDPINPLCSEMYHMDLADFEEAPQPEFECNDLHSLNEISSSDILEANSIAELKIPMGIFEDNFVQITLSDTQPDVSEVLDKLVWAGQFEDTDGDGWGELEFEVPGNIEGPHILSIFSMDFTNCFNFSAIIQEI